MKKNFKVLAYAAAALGIYGVAENVLGFSTRHEGECGKVGILHISDLHSRNNERIIKKIISTAIVEAPELIFVTGDIVSRSETDFTAVEGLLKKLCRIAPVYMCLGNHEQSLPYYMRKKFLEAVRRTDVKLLINNGEFVEIKGERYYICGVMPPYETYKKNGGYSNLDDFTFAQMKALMGEAPKEKVLLLAHNPKFAEVYANWGADSVFSGHVHGGIVRIFGVGLLSPERRFFPKYSKGAYTVERCRSHEKKADMNLFVSAGIGKMRLFNPPEAVVYKL